MTKEEAKQKLWPTGNINILSKVECDKILEETFNHFEEQILELETANTDLHNQIIMIENRTCENCKYCLEDSNNTDVWLECRKPDSPMEYHSVITDIIGYLTTDFCCNRWEPRDD